MLKQLLSFTERFSTMAEAGLSYPHIFSTLIKHYPPGLFRSALADIHNRISQGESLAHAMSKHPRIFNEWYVEIISAGEEAGKLEDVLDQIKYYLRKTLQFRRELIKAAIYPTMMLAGGILILITLRFVLIPIFVGKESVVSAQLDDILTLFNRIFLGVFGGIGLIITVNLIYATLPKSRIIIDGIKMCIPVLGEVFRLRDIAKFARTLGTMVSAGVPILQALKLTKSAIPNTIIKRNIDTILQNVQKGGNITNSLKESSIFDARIVGMMEVGEESGKLDQTLLKVAEYYEEEFADSLTILMRVAEVMLLISYVFIMGYVILKLWGTTMRM